MENAPPHAKRILIVAIETGRWGPARLPAALKSAGFEVASLCPDGNALSATRFLDRRFSLQRTRSSTKMAADIAAAIKAWQPWLVVPADEQVVALLHAIIRRPRAMPAVDAEVMATLKTSLGDPEMFDATLFKSETMALAKRLGVRIPTSVTVSSTDAAIEAADRIGYPVYVKQSFGWSGTGVKLCRTEEDVCVAMTAPADTFLRRAKAQLRRLMRRDWYPTGQPVDIQQVIHGLPAMYSCVAIDGQLLAGVAGTKCRTLVPNGPSMVVELGPNVEMAATATAMVKAFGANGFFSFDFIVEDGTGHAYLLECNPRPNQVFHLGETVGVNLMAALAAGPAGNAPKTASCVRPITLYPQAFLGPLDCELPPDAWLDKPRDDPTLLAFMEGKIAEVRASRPQR